MSDPMHGENRCKAHARSGARCKNPPVTGATVCRMHGGSSPQVKAKAQKRIERECAEEAVLTYGLPREIGPHEALLEEVHRTAGHVAWLGSVVQGIEQQKVAHGITKTVQLPDGGRRVEAEAAISVWVRLYQEERAHLVRVARSAVEAGVAERTVKLAEDQAQRLADVVSAILTDLGHDLADEQTRKVVRLRMIEGGKAAA